MTKAKNVTKTTTTKASKKKVVVTQTSALENLWNTPSFRTKMVEQGRETMTKIWNRRGFKKQIREGMKAKWADPAFRAMMQRRMAEARAAKLAQA
jgi:hypothetical protein